MSRRRNPRRASALLARSFLLDSDSENEEEMGLQFIRLMQAALMHSSRRSRSKCNKTTDRNKARKKGPPKIKANESAVSVPDIDLSETVENIVSDTVKDTHQKSVEDRVDNFFKSGNLLSDDDEDLFAAKPNITTEPTKVSKDFYILTDSDDDMPSTSIACVDTTIENDKPTTNKDDELMEIVDKILDSNDIPVETTSEPDNWNEFKSKTEEILGSVNALLGTLHDDKPKEEVVDLSEEDPVKTKPTCPICLEVLDGNIVPGATICGHIFCLECIQKVAKTSKTCPTCRKRINLKQVHPLYL